MRTIKRTFGFLYAFHYGDDSSDDSLTYDVDYTIFLFEDGSVRWNEGKEHTQSYAQGDTISEAQWEELDPFETLPEDYTVEQLIHWDD